MLALEVASPYVKVLIINKYDKNYISIFQLAFKTIRLQAVLKVRLRYYFIENRYIEPLYCR